MTTIDPVIIIGAGMAGLTAARILDERGVEAVVVDKGRAPGGRMATRTVGDARFDHGAQHFSSRDPAFNDAVAGWERDGLVSTWYASESLTNPDLGVEPRRVGTGGMRRLPEHLADGLDVRTGLRVTGIDNDDGGLAVRADGLELRGSALVLTPPLPQLLALIDTGSIPLPDDIRTRLEAIEYEQCLAGMAHLDGPSGLEDGHHAGNGPAVAWIGDNQHKGTSPVPAVTIHSTPGFAEDHGDDDPDHWVDLLGRAAEPTLASSITEAIGHRWALSRPTTTMDDGAIVLEGPSPVVLAGEVFAGARVEGAFLSGRAAAHALTDTI